MHESDSDVACVSRALPNIMQVVVHYLAQIRQAAGVPFEAFTLDDGATVLDLVFGAVDRHGDAIRRFLLNGAGQLHDSILVFVGDEQTTWQSRQALRDGDQVT